MDLSHIKEISAGDEVFVRTLLQKMRDQLPQDLAELEQSVAARDYPEIAQKAHKLKSPARILFMDDLVIELEKLENTPPGNEQTIDTVYQKAQQIIEHLMAKIDNYLS